MTLLNSSIVEAVKCLTPPPSHDFHFLLRVFKLTGTQRFNLNFLLSNNRTKLPVGARRHHSVVFAFVHSQSAAGKSCQLAVGCFSKTTLLSSMSSNSDHNGHTAGSICIYISIHIDTYLFKCTTEGGCRCGLCVCVFQWVYDTVFEMLVAPFRYFNLLVKIPFVKPLPSHASNRC